MTALAVTAAATSAAPKALSAQGAPAAAAGNVLTLADAITLALRNSPTLQSSRNARATAAANVRAANGQFLPQFSTSFGAGYREGRQQFFAGQSIGSTNNLLSTDASANFSLNLSPGALNDLRTVKANRDAVEHDIVVGEQTVRINVTNQYLTALQQAARATLQDSLLLTTAAQLQLAQARLQVGAGTQLDVQQAEVADGQQRVAALQAKNQAQIEIVRLFQQMGMPAVLDTRLDPNLPPTPTLDMAQVMEMARRTNPQLQALSTREEAARQSLTSARRAYFPSLSLSAGVSGFTNRYTDVDAFVASNQAGVVSQP